MCSPLSRRVSHFAACAPGPDYAASRHCAMRYAQTWRGSERVPRSPLDPRSSLAETLADSLRIAACTLPRTLVPPHEVKHLISFAHRLPPVHAAGFECQLNGTRGRVDLQQRVRPQDAEPLRFAAHLLSAGLCTLGGWRRIRDFMLAWDSRAGDLKPLVVECWLEYESVSRPTPPSIFLSFSRTANLLARNKALRRALRLLVPPREAIRLERAALAVSDKLPAGAAIHDIGLMARRPAVIRINVGVERVELLDAVLQSLSRDSAERERVAEIVREFVPFAESIKLAFDCRRGLQPGVGLEIFPGADLERPLTTLEQARWRKLLDVAVARGWCGAPHRAALLQWPGHAEPPAVALAWPDSLIAESLLHSPSAFSVIGRRLSHVKIQVTPGGEPQLKAYFGYLRLRHGAPSSNIARTGRAKSVAAAIERGVSFLLAARRESMYWWDFPDIEGGSDAWLTAYVAGLLSQSRIRGGKSAAKAAWNWLAARGVRGGWAYNDRLPIDADSILWVIRLAGALGHLRTPIAQTGMRQLRLHRQRDGGVATYLPSQFGAQSARGLPRSHAGWCQAHAEVTAAAGSVPGFGASSASWLRRTQQTDGSWSSYWYGDDAFATALAAEHLTQHSRVALRVPIERAVAWAAGRVGPDGTVAATGISGDSAFAAASCLRLLLLERRRKRRQALAERVIRRLFATQMVDGSWPGSTPMLLPPPSTVHPLAISSRDGFSWDRQGIFTTATVLDALSRLASPRGR